MGTRAHMSDVVRVQQVFQLLTQGNLSMSKYLIAIGFKSKQRGLTVVEYVLGAVALVVIVGVAVLAFGDVLMAAFQSIDFTP